MRNDINIETYVIDGKHVVDAIINIRERTVQCKMYTEQFSVDFYSEKFLSGKDIDYASIIFEEAKNFIPQFDQMEKECVNQKSAE